jgi:hypothetical protein
MGVTLVEPDKGPGHRRNRGEREEKEREGVNGVSHGRNNSIIRSKHVSQTQFPPRDRASGDPCVELLQGDNPSAQVWVQKRPD